MINNSVLVLFAILQLKHLLVDWCWQPEYEWKNKGIFGHWGGIRHSVKNGFGTAICFGIMGIAFPTIFYVFCIDFGVHYLIDWCKMNINKKMGWAPTTHNQFWWLTGLDQCLHQLCYILLIFIFVG